MPEIRNDKRKRWKDYYEGDSNRIKIAVAAIVIIVAIVAAVLLLSKSATELKDVPVSEITADRIERIIQSAPSLPSNTTIMVSFYNRDSVDINVSFVVTENGVARGTTTRYDMLFKTGSYFIPLFESNPFCDVAKAIFASGDYIFDTQNQTAAQQKFASLLQCIE